MNERIKELNAQADKHAWEKVGKKYDGKGDLNWEWEDAKMAKFAELLVQECIQTVKNQSMQSSDEWEDGLQIAEGAIRKHFGIKYERPNQED